LTVVQKTLTKATHKEMRHNVLTADTVVTDFFFNNQPDALINQIYSVIKL